MAQLSPRPSCSRVGSILLLALVGLALGCADRGDEVSRGDEAQDPTLAGEGGGAGNEDGAGEEGGGGEDARADGGAGDALETAAGGDTEGEDGTPTGTETGNDTGTTATTGGSSPATGTGGAWLAAGGSSSVSGSGGAASSYGAAGGASSGDSGTPQTWQRTTDEVRFGEVALGGGQTLELERVRVATLIEGLRARTLVDHIYYNPHPDTIEGTFRYPLPAEASISYFATAVGTQAAEPVFFGPDDALGSADFAEQTKARPEDVLAGADGAVWQPGKAARVVRKVAATAAYESETRAAVDPALVEEVAPNRFEGRVFPIPASGWIRVVVAYEQTLPRVGDGLEYVLPVPAGPIDGLEVTVAAPQAAVASLAYTGTVAGVEPAASATASAFTYAVADDSPGGDLRFLVTPVDEDPTREVLSGTDPTRGESYFAVRLRSELPDLPASTGGADQAVFLLDTSYSAEPDQFRVGVELLERILVESPTIERFNVVTFDAGARWLDDAWYTNDEAGRGAALDAVGAILLEGATDFGSALRTLAAPPFEVPAGSDLDAFVLSDGVVSWGERSVARLVAEYEETSPFATRFFAYRTGLGADNLELFRALTRRGGIFNCLGEASVPACATAHQSAGLELEAVTVTGVGEAPATVGDVLVAGRQATLFPGAELTVAGRLLAPGAAEVTLRGSSGGTTTELTFPVELVPVGELAPRAWAEIAVSQLLTPEDDELEPLAVAIAQHFMIASRETSFLMLESEATYEEYDIADEGARFDDQPVATIVEDALAEYSVRTSWDDLLEVLTVNDAYTRLSGTDLVERISGLVDASELELPTTPATLPAVLRAAVPAEYLAAMSHSPDAPVPFIDEAERRFDAGASRDAVRALSTLIENDPGNSATARQVGYRMSSWGTSADAAGLLYRVLASRPFEPQSYRDLANVLGLERPALSTLLFESVLLGEYDARFGLAVTVVGEEYALFARELARAEPAHPLNPLLAERMGAHSLTAPTGDLRVTITWNTDATDIDLWVTDPLGEKCYYADRELESGGTLLDDLTQGFGPERFAAETTIPGTYRVEVHYFGNNGNRLLAETYVNAIVVTHAGTDEERVDRYDVLLENVGDVVTVAEVTFP